MNDAQAKKKALAKVRQWHGKSKAIDKKKLREYRRWLTHVLLYNQRLAEETRFED